MEFASAITYFNSRGKNTREVIFSFMRIVGARALLTIRYVRFGSGALANRTASNQTSASNYNRVSTDFYTRLFCLANFGSDPIRFTRVTLTSLNDCVKGIRVQMASFVIISIDARIFINDVKHTRLSNLYVNRRSITALSNENSNRGVSFGHATNDVFFFNFRNCFDQGTFQYANEHRSTRSSNIFVLSGNDDFNYYGFIRSREISFLVIVHFCR